MWEWKTCHTYYHETPGPYIIRILFVANFAMSLFGPNRPKGITKEELHFIQGELKVGHSAERLTDYQVDDIMEKLTIALDPDSGIGMKKKWSQIDATEVAEIEELAGNAKGIKYSPAQQERIHEVLKKYLDINRVRSFF